ncbi:MAG: CoB--CoM heterodisulfide reductase iron-sulfur subunit A family protein [Desulfomonile tiedjei]|uniref:CoB--CoM heterodisulfide reductase iron-sulfur subunit A family protein n=1 Tax=Desulfomonile tiedjei TaxID=2358 RepID=A0A9D6V050_9BACT|nr:CoB--CoM heterodisulfide reductase iron-sulfur subunit A family protein [Desulfomonile tiedjei]
MAGNKTVLVVGGGISGITAAVEAAEAGCKVILVEKLPYLGGRVAQLNKYFPKLCPPTCGLEINFKRIRRNPDIAVYTLAEVVNISGTAGNYNATIRVTPRYVEDRTATSKCVEDCPVEISNDFNYGMDKTKAVHLPYEMAYPMNLVADRDALLKVQGQAAYNAFIESCNAKGIRIDLDAKPETFDLEVDSVVWATGWRPYDPTKLDKLGFGVCTNVITNVMMERLASFAGPTKGEILRPSDGKKVNNLAFVQCAGSRDRNHLPYCSSICCLASLKQATYLRDYNPDAQAHIFYIDLRAYGRFEYFYDRVRNDEKILLTKGKIVSITEDPATKDVILEGEDILSGQKIRRTFDMAVLATGMQPNTSLEKIPGPDVQYDEFGFVISDKGIHAAGVTKRPMDVGTCLQDATGAAIKALQDTVGR